MRFALASAVVGAVFFATGSAMAGPMPLAAVAAAPAAMLQPAVSHGNEAKLILVRGGCGWGAHRSWSGRCHYNRGWRGHARAWRRWHR